MCTFTIRLLYTSICIYFTQVQHIKPQLVKKANQDDVIFAESVDIEHIDVLEGSKIVSFKQLVAFGSEI